jgi:hypothetical protein
VATYGQIPLIDRAPPAEGGALLSSARSADAVDPSRARSCAPQKRASVRSKAFLKAHIRIHNLPAMDCVVRNVSPSGARLEVDETFALPMEFELEIPQRGVVLMCEVKWRRDDLVGVKFLDHQGPHTPTAEAMEKLQRENARLRRENARLKTRVEELIGGF